MAGSAEVKTLLCRHKASLLRELNSTDLLNVLVKRGIITEVDRAAVAGSVDRPSETDIDLFVDVIGAKGFDAFREFCYALEAECPHVLRDLLVDQHNITAEDNQVQESGQQQQPKYREVEDDDVKCVENTDAPSSTTEDTDDHLRRSDVNINASDSDIKESMETESRRCSDVAGFPDCPRDTSPERATPSSSPPPSFTNHQSSYPLPNGMISATDPILEVLDEPVDEPVCHLKTLIDEEDTLVRNITNIMKFFFTKDVTLSFTAVRKSEDKKIFKDTTFCDCVESVVLQNRGNENILAKRKKFYKAIGSVFLNAKDWAGGRTARRKKSMPCDQYQYEQYDQCDEDEEMSLPEDVVYIKQEVLDD